MAALQVVRAEGDPISRGRVIGRQLGGLIEHSLGFYHRYFERRGVASRELQDVLSPYLAAAETAFPGPLDLIKGMAEGAMVPVWELFAVNAFEELEPLLETEDEGGFLEHKQGRALRPPAPGRCSTVTVAGPGFTILGHNEHWLAGDMGNVAVVIDIPSDGGGPAVASPTVVCCLPSVGMNEHRGAQGIASLVAADDGRGIPRVLVSRCSLGAADRLDAVKLTAIPGRAGGYAHSFAFRGGDTFMIETTATRESLLEGPGPHTNHYLDPQLAGLGARPSFGSATRYERLLELLEERRPDSPSGVMDMLRDHGEGRGAICLHPDEDEGEEASTVVFSMVCDVEDGRMWVAPGNPCVNPYEEIDLTGVA